MFRQFVWFFYRDGGLFVVFRFSLSVSLLRYCPSIGRVGFVRARKNVTVGRVVSAPTTPTTVNPCSRTVRTNNLLFLSNAVPVSPTANTLTRPRVTTRTRRIVGGVNTILRTTNYAFRSMIGAAYFLTSVTSFTTFGRVCTHCFAKGPTHSYITIGSLPGNTLIRIRIVTSRWDGGNAGPF